MLDLLPYFVGLKGKVLYEGYEYVNMTYPGRGQGTAGLPGVAASDITFLADLQNCQINADGTKTRFTLLDRLPKQVMSSLQPYLKLYKVFYKNADDFVGTTLQFPLNNFKNPEEISPTEQLYAGKPPGHLAVGLKDFSFDYLGSNPAEVETFIDCKLKLYFSSVDALYHSYGKGPNKNVSFLDLIKRPKKYVSPKDNPREFARQYNPRYFRIRADIGYTMPDDKFLQQACEHLPGISPSTLANEIQNNRISFFLTLSRHVLKPALDVPSGPFEIEMTFNAAVENALGSPNANVLITGMTGEEEDRIEASNVYKDLELMKRVVAEEFKHLTTNPDGIPAILSGYDAEDFFTIESGSPANPFQFLNLETRYTVNEETFLRVLEEDVPESERVKSRFDQSILGGGWHGGRHTGLRWGGEGSFKRRTGGYAMPEWDAHTGEGHDFSDAPEVFETGLQQHTIEARERIGSEKNKKVYNVDHMPSLHDLHWAYNPWRKGPRRVAMLFDYFKYRSRVERLKAKWGVSDDMLRIKAYNRFLTELMYPVNRLDTEGEPPPINEKNGAQYVDNVVKVVCAPIRRSVIRSYNRKRISTQYTKKEIKELKKEEAEGNKAAAAAIRQTRQMRIDDLTEFVGKLETGEYFDTSGQEASGDLGLNMRLQQWKYYASVVEKVQDPSKELKVPEFAIAKPKLNLKDIDGEVDMRWCYFGDVIDTAIKILIGENNRLNTTLSLNNWNRYEANGPNKLHIVMGNFEYQTRPADPARGMENVETYPLARFPIPLRNIVAWWTKKVVEPKLESYPLRQFMKDALVDLVLNPLNKKTRPWAPSESYKAHCEVLSIGRRNGTKMKAAQQDQQKWSHTSTWQRPGIFGMDPGPLRTETIHGLTANRAWYVYPAANDGQQQEMFFLGIQKNDQKSMFANDRKLDKQRGILYLEMKRDGTPLYSINFNRSDQPFQLEARAERGILTEALSLSEVYNCKFTSVGNLGLKPGRFIYISDPHFGDINSFVKKMKKQPSADVTDLYSVENASRLLGFGGYYVITKTRHKMKGVGDRLVWKTEADCFWNSFGYDVEGAMAATTALAEAATTATLATLGGRPLLAETNALVGQGFGGMMGSIERIRQAGESASKWQRIENLSVAEMRRLYGRGSWNFRTESGRKLRLSLNPAQKYDWYVHPDHKPVVAESAMERGIGDLWHDGPGSIFDND